MRLSTVIIFPGTKQPIDETLGAFPAHSVCATGNRLVGVGLAVTRQEGDVEQLAHCVAYLHQAGGVVVHVGQASAGSSDSMSAKLVGIGRVPACTSARIS